MADAVSIAHALRETVYNRLRAGLDRVLSSLASPCQGLILSGEGEFAARSVLKSMPELSTRPKYSLSELLGSTHSGAACAFALSRLATEHCVL